MKPTCVPMREVFTALASGERMNGQQQDQMAIKIIYSLVDSVVRDKDLSAESQRAAYSHLLHAIWYLNRS